MRILLLALIAVAGFMAYAVLWLWRLDPVAWQAPPAHALDTDTHPVSERKRLGVGTGTGPQTVAIGRDEQLCLGSLEANAIGRVPRTT